MLAKEGLHAQKCRHVGRHHAHRRRVGGLACEHRPRGPPSLPGIPVLVAILSGMKVTEGIAGLAPCSTCWEREPTIPMSTGLADEAEETTALHP